ncbi:MAG: serine hydrolase domain-containing protein [Bacillota bacterium]
MKYSAERIAAFENYLEQIRQAYQAPGIVVALAEQGEVTYQASFGHRDLAAGLPVDGQTIFGLASVTKSFTALAIMQLAERGLLQPEDPVVRYLPEFGLPTGADAQAVTIHHLLTHTAGFPPLPTLNYSITGNTVPDEPESEDEDGAKDKPENPRVDTMADLLDYLKNGDYEMLGQPGEYLSYSNDCYGLLGEIVERVSGEPYQEYVRRHILQPLGMERSVFTVEELQALDNVTELYYRTRDEELKHSSNWQVAPPFVACGWLKSCVDDLIKYAQMYANGGKWGEERLLSAAGVERMRQRTLEFTENRRYGYGLVVQDYAGVTLVDHGGSLKGVSSNMGFVPEKGIAAVVLCNTSGVPVAKIYHALINLALGLPIEEPRRTYRHQPWPEDLMEKVVGAYKSGEGATYTIEKSGDGLSIGGWLGTFPLYATGSASAVWHYRYSDNEVRFMADADGEVWAIHAGGRVIPRKKPE